MFRTDSDIQQDVVDELKWEPGLRDDDIAVGTKDGIVTLAGFVDSYADKYRAERVASRVKGVKGIANNIEVKLPSSSTRTDPEIARAAVDALKWDIWVPSDRITVKVRGNKVVLRGTVRSYAEKRDAERAARNAPGVTEVDNRLIVDPSVTAPV